MIRNRALGDGWHPTNLTPGELRAGVATYRQRCADFGRAPGPVVLRHMPAPGTPLPTPHDVGAYADAGLDELLFSLPLRTADDLLDALGELKATVG